MGIKNFIKKKALKASDRIAKLSTLSPEQLESVIEQREKYYEELAKHDPNDPASEVYTGGLLAAAGVEIFGEYLPRLKDLYVPIESNTAYDSAFNPNYNIRYFNITKWVVDNEENSLEKLINVYDVLSNEDCNIALIFHRSTDRTDVFLAVTNNDNSDNNIQARDYSKRLRNAVKGNFPGSELNEPQSGIPDFLKDTDGYSVASASNIPTEKSDKFISQTIEKLIDGFIPEKISQEYTLILLATPILDIEERKLRLSELYSGLAPYAGWQTNFTFTELTGTGASATFGVNVGTSAGVQNGTNNSVTNSDSNTDSSSTAETDSSSNTDTEGTSESESESNAHSEGTSDVNTTSDSTNGSTGTSTTNSNGTTNTEGKSSTGNASIPIVSGSWGKNSSTAVTETVANATTSQSGWVKTTAKALGKTASDTITKGKTLGKTLSKAATKGKSLTNTLGKAVTKGVSKTTGAFKSTNFGVNFGMNFARSSNYVATLGKNEAITQSFTNYTIKHALEMLEEQMKRYEISTALGMWDFAAYVISEDHNVANNVAHSYIALTQGEESFMSHASINLWRGDLSTSDDAKEICQYLKELRHPEFGLDPVLSQADPTLNAYPPLVTATTPLSGKELAYSLNFPKKSVAGLPVMVCAEFGRNVTSFDPDNETEKKIKLGKIFHMLHTEPTPVKLSKDSLASHTFITGSTGSGKSNTVYHILNKARGKGVHFLVIEPAKGEYKNVFGSDDDVSVYGTNPLVAPLLRIDPFSFPNDVHILEHMDRLVEIFNVCWPMYAAMPAVLKSAVEKSYVDCGWDLVTSKNKYDRNFYPDLATVAKNIKIIIDSSEYDTENKGAYKGSLLTRLQSLANGINGLIFSSDELSGEELFDRNVIVDLSRVGSTETKSLIMGLLVLKLQEYRSSCGLPMNSKLNHLTVLEEAHNLLRRTSTEQSTETANLLGKSVEMLANAIAEMRTYGEGFIIADQAPGLMDMSVIRNTNTKIIMRLPDQGDRELVGRAANLNDDQIKELAKLPCGVAAVYQNEWVQAVLCKVDKYDTDEAEYKFDPSVNDAIIGQSEEVKDELLKCIMDKELFQRGDKQDIKELKSIILRSRLSTVVKVDFLEYIEAEQEQGMETLQRLIYDLLEAEKAIESAGVIDDIHEWVNAVLKKLKPTISDYSKKQIDLATALILHEKAIRDNLYQGRYISFTVEFKKGGDMF